MKFHIAIANAINILAVAKAASVSTQQINSSASYPNCFELVKDAIYDCGSATDSIHVHEVSFDPKPKPGHSSIMTIVGKSRAGLDFTSRGNLTIKHYGAIVHEEEYVVCDTHGDEHQHGKKVCPKEEGKHVKLVKEFHFKAHDQHGNFDFEDVAHNGHHDHRRKVLFHIKARF